MHMTIHTDIELYDKVKNGAYSFTWHKRVTLCAKGNRDPSRIGSELTKKIAETKSVIDKSSRPYVWSSELVGALLIVRSADKTEPLPSFQPCQRIHKHIDFLYRIFLDPEYFQYEIQCLSVGWDWDKGLMKRLEPVNWLVQAEQE